MKLLSKTSISYLWVSFAVLFVMGIMLFLFLKTAVSQEVKEQLELETDMVMADLMEGKPISSPLLNIRKLALKDLEKPLLFKDTLIYDRIQKEQEGYYLLRSVKLVKGQAVEITVMNTYIGWDGYVQAIGIIFILMAFSLVIAGAFVNYSINKKIWSPFLFNLSLLTKYSVSSKAPLELKASAIDEFEDLNLVIKGLVKRARIEYVDLKEFTENVSHEIQTPLSILKSRLESISQLPMDADLSRFLVDAKMAADRLSRVNKGLLLLAKLKNDQFEDIKMVQLDQILHTNLVLMEDLFEQRNLGLQQEIAPKEVLTSPHLMEILITNLLSNLRIHATPGTTVRIRLNAAGMEFANQGQPLQFPEEKLFSRFGKTFNGYAGTGLGLSIIKQICIINNWEISYAYRESQHIFSVNFSPEKNRE